ncbi:MAG: hypothetical protein QOD72_3568 [Acidimicrobiaceae bacterium]|nr:hypothetical protein [Acidimicrobiaceae bacterium]
MPPWEPSVGEPAAEKGDVHPAGAPPPVIPPARPHSRRAIVLAGLLAFFVGYGAGWGTDRLTEWHDRAEVAPSPIGGQTTVSRNATSEAGSFTTTPSA